MYEYMHTDSTYEYMHTDSMYEYMHTDSMYEYMHIDSMYEYMHTDSTYEYMHTDSTYEYIHTDRQTFYSATRILFFSTLFSHHAPALIQIVHRHAAHPLPVEGPPLVVLALGGLHDVDL